MIDLSDNTDAGFYAAGNHYDVGIADITIDGQTVRAWIGSFDIGPAQVNLVQILGTTLTETAGQIAAAFKKFFDKASPTGTVNSIPDAVAGAAGGLFIAGTNAATIVTTSFTTTFTGNLTGSAGSVAGAVGSVNGSVGSIAAGGISATSFSASAITATAIAADAITDAKVAADVTIASVTGAVGSVTGAVGSVTGLTASDVGAIKAKTDNLPSDPADQSLVIAATDAITTAIAAVQSDTDNIQTRLPAALVGGRMDASAGALAANVITAAATHTDFLAEINAEADTALADVGLTTTVTSRIDAAISTRASQTSLDTVDDFVDTEIAAIKAKTDLIPGTQDGFTFAEYVKLSGAVACGKVSGLPGSPVFRSMNDTSNRVTATTDADGNRSAVTLNP